VAFSPPRVCTHETRTTARAAAWRTTFVVVDPDHRWSRGDPTDPGRDASRGRPSGDRPKICHVQAGVQLLRIRARIHAHGIAMQAGIVFGFDHDTEAVFDETLECLSPPFRTSPQKQVGRAKPALERVTPIGRRL
jgi:hypothetical protein